MICLASVLFLLHPFILPLLVGQRVISYMHTDMGHICQISKLYNMTRHICVYIYCNLNAREEMER